MNNLKLESIAISILVYLVIVVAILFSLVYSPPKKEATTYVEKQGRILEVSLGSPIPKKAPLVQKPSKKESKKVEKKAPKKKSSKKKPKKRVVKKKVQPKKAQKKKRVSKVRNVKSSPKKVVKKSKVAKKVKKATKKVVKKEQPKPKKSPNTQKLFGSIKDVTKEGKKKESRAKESLASSKGEGGKRATTKKNQGKGKENKYLGRVSRILRGWPAQSNFAGEKIRVRLVIYPSGLFDYKILYKSLNPEFNEALKNYLEQLKNMGGFGPHTNPKPYNIEVEFIAK